MSAAAAVAVFLTLTLPPPARAAPLRLSVDPTTRLRADFGAARWPVTADAALRDTTRLPAVVGMSACATPSPVCPRGTSPTTGHTPTPPHPTLTLTGNRAGVVQTATPTSRLPEARPS